ncbi:MAG: phenylacetate--CoA ligase family protein, partial [Planctomycetota bacterium]
MLNNSATRLARRQIRQCDRDWLRTHQCERIRSLWTTWREHPLYRDALTTLDAIDGRSDDLAVWWSFFELPLQRKSDILPESPDAPSRLFCGPVGDYVRFHQTSGSRGFAMPVLDTHHDWNWWLHCWQHVLDAADVTSQDIAFMAFSFGPFIGFWSAHDALVDRGALVVPGGGLSTEARLRLMLRQRCTVVCCTPTYALHMARVADELGIDLASSSVRCLIVAGEPGGSIPSIRESLGRRWNARIVDHAGASELGAWGFATDNDDGLHVLESEFIAEFAIIGPDDQVAGYWTPEQARESNEEAPQCELVLTNLGRLGGPLVRYRTGDVVRPQWDHGHECRFVKLAGGVLGRTDDMVIIRGVNVFPSSIEAIVRERLPSAEFRVTAFRQNDLDALRLDV